MRKNLENEISGLTCVKDENGVLGEGWVDWWVVIGGCDGWV